MDLKDFIAATLVQIQEGVQEAIYRRSHSHGSAGAINPAWGNIGEHHLQDVQFDVAVTVSDKSSHAAGEKLTVAGIGSGSESSSKTENSTLSRIKFTVPIVPPVQSVVDQN